MPMAWTRGLKPDGRWSETSLYGGQVGYVMLVRGQVERKRPTEHPLTPSKPTW
jgi:hypothetical protein